MRLRRRGAPRFVVGIAVAALVVAVTTAATGTATPPALTRANQLLVVTTTTWDATGGTLRRYSRDAAGAWRAEGAPIPVVVGRTGLAWGVGVAPDAAGEPAKREGDGKSPTGVFPLARSSASRRVGRRWERGYRICRWSGPRIFLHVWNGPRSSTAGCTAMAEPALAEIARWLDPARRPALVQLTEAAYARRRATWGLP